MQYGSKLLLIITGTILLYALFLIFFDIQKLENKIIDFDINYVPVILSLVTVSWTPLYIRWHLLLKNTGIELSFQGNVVIYLSSLALSITPGKVGELVRTQLLKNKYGISRTKTIPLIFVEKLYDLTGAVITSIIGIWFFREAGYIIVVALVLIVFLFIFISSKRIFKKSINWFSKFTITEKFFKPLTESYETIKISTRSKIALYSSLLSILYWLIISLAVYFILQAFNVTINYLSVIPTFIASLFLGAVSFIPGGIGVAEGSLVGLLALQGIELSFAVVIVVVIRLFTLWYGVLIGFIALKMSRGFSQNNNSLIN